jgi:2-polyprenyl-6-methoxyphenol hydroxylase-like FAD-dependent oxidoreductase
VIRTARAPRDIAILGSGPAGLAAALALSGRGGARIITPGLPAATDVPRVDMVPAALLAFLLELGIHPGQIGVHDLHDERRIAWSDAVPETVRGSAVAHVERPALELALLAALERTSGFKIIPSPAAHPTDPGERVVDATGRRAVSATRTTGLAKPWIARVFSRHGVFDKADQAFRLAALPAGYAYRLASPRLLAIGVVVSKAAGMTPKDIEKYVHAADAGWVLEGLGSLDSIQAGKGGVASVQWSAGPAATLRVGDASLARDSLSAQGLCSGISDAVSLVRNSGHADRWPNREREQLKRHLACLANAMERSRFRAEKPWAEYRRFLERASGLAAVE